MSDVSLHGVQLCIISLAYPGLSIFSRVDILSTTQALVKCSAAKYSWIDSSLDVGWSSWCVHCAKDGSRGPAKGTCQSRSQRLTFCGQMMVWPQTGLLLGCPMCRHPRPSFQDMRSLTTHLGSICLLRSVSTLDLLSTLGCCLFHTDAYWPLYWPKLPTRVFQAGYSPLLLSLTYPCITCNCVLCIWDHLTHTIPSQSQYYTLKHSSHMVACH